MIFEVLSGNKGYSGNSQIDGLDAARYMQTPAEHRQWIDPATNPLTARQYFAAMHIPDPATRRNIIAQLEAQAIADEQARPQYWVNDQYPREPVQSSSSWVGNVDYYPPKNGKGKGTAWIQLGEKWYSYPGVSPQGMVNFLTSSSLGKYLNKLKPYHNEDFYLKM